MTAVYSYVIQTAITVGVPNTPSVNLRNTNETSLSISSRQRPNLITIPQDSATISTKQTCSFATLNNTTLPIHWLSVPQTVITMDIKNAPLSLLPGTVTTLYLSSLVDPESPEPTPVPQPEGRFYWG